MTLLLYFSEDGETECKEYYDDYWIFGEEASGEGETPEYEKDEENEGSGSGSGEKGNWRLKLICSLIGKCNY